METSIYRSVLPRPAQVPLVFRPLKIRDTAIVDDPGTQVVPGSSLLSTTASGYVSFRG